MTTTRAMRTALIIWALATSSTLAEDRPAELLGIDARARKLIDEAADQISQGQNLEAVSRLQQILRKASHDLVPTTEPNSHRPARWECHRLIASLPPEGLRLYRLRAEPAARKWLDIGRERLDPRSLRRVIDEAFCTRAGEEALLLLGEMAFADGDFESARRYWAHLIPDSHPLGLKYPDPTTDPAELRARLIVCLIFAGRTAEAERAIDAFRERHPEAMGRVAGSEGRLIDILTALESPGFSRPHLWPTFASSITRNAASDEHPPYYWPERPTWSIPIPIAEQRDDPNEVVPLESDPHTLAFHPVIDHDNVWIADAGRVMRFDSLSGEFRGILDLRDTLNPFDFDLRLPPREHRRYTLSLRDGSVFARLGATLVEPGSEAHSTVQIRVGQDDQKPMWELPNAANEVWDGAPLLLGDRMFSLLSRFDGGKLITRIEAHFGLDGERPELDWQRDVTEESFNPGGADRHLHAILSSDGRHIFHCTHAGWVIALDAETGSLAWAYRYPLAGRAMSPLREPGPCLIAHGRLFVAPADADCIFCLDAYTGDLIWEYPLIVGNLIGVVDGSLVGTTVGGVPGIFALDVTDGSRIWFKHDVGGGDLRPHGQGFVTNRAIFWPTNHGLYFLDPKSGNPLRPPSTAATGNLAYADGVLVVATGTYLHGYVAERRFLSERTGKSLRRPFDAEARYQLGLALADAGLPELAVTHLRAAGERGQPRAEQLVAALKPIPIQDRGPRPHLTAKLTGNEAADLRPPLSVAWRRESGARSLCFFGSAAERGAISDVDRLIALHLETGDEIWMRQLPFVPRQGWPMPDGLLVAGPGGVSRLRSDGVILWDWAPDLISRRGELPVASELGPSNEPRLSAFHVEGGRLIALQDEQALLALDLTDGALIWSCDALDREELTTAEGPRFCEYYATTPEHVLIQRSTGDVWRLNIATGRAEVETPGSGAEAPTWSSSPLSLPDGSFVLAVEAEHIRRTGPTRWETTLDRPSGLTGEPAQLLAAGQVVVCRVRRNHGDELIALDRDRGTSVWDRPTFSLDRIDLTCAYADEMRIVLPVGGRVIALATANATQLWERELPESLRGCKLRIRSMGAALAVVPDAAWPEGGWARFGDQAQRHAVEMAKHRDWMHLWRLMRTLSGANVEWHDDMVLLDPIGGELFQRLRFPAAGPSGGIRWAGRQAIVATGAEVWALRSYRE